MGIKSLAEVQFVLYLFRVMRMIKRIRDPVHGLITFDLSKEVDRAAWRLINTPEFQRLRRVKQLGVSEFVFPGATHTRLSHSIGVFHLARRLMEVAERYVPADKLSQSRKRTALLASLLHDLGHGPFSHAFENAEKARIEAQKEASQAQIDADKKKVEAQAEADKAKADAAKP